MDDRSHIDASSPPQKKLFCFGYGYVAEHLSKELKKQDSTWQICGTTRDKEKMNLMRKEGVKAFLFSDEMPLDDPLFILDGATHVLISTPPNDSGDITFQAHARDLSQIKTIQWMGYCSSTSVYGNRDGDWVDEFSEVRPTSRRGSRRAKAESAWLKMRRIAKIPINIFRLAGIYGPERSAIDAVRAGRSNRIDKPGHAFNRIHIDDIVQVLVASFSQPTPGDIYNLSDDEPTQSHELIDYACQLLGKESPPLLSYDKADMSPMTQSFYSDNKRIRNSKIKEKLDVTLKYPNYKSGLDAIFEQEEQNHP